MVPPPAKQTGFKTNMTTIEMINGIKEIERHAGRLAVGYAYALHSFQNAPANNFVDPNFMDELRAQSSKWTRRNEEASAMIEYLKSINP